MSSWNGRSKKAKRYLKAINERRDKCSINERNKRCYKLRNIKSKIIWKCDEKQILKESKAQETPINWKLARKVSLSDRPKVSFMVEIYQSYKREPRRWHDWWII